MKRRASSQRRHSRQKLLALANNPSIHNNLRQLFVIKEELAQMEASIVPTDDTDSIPAPPQLVSTPSSTSTTSTTSTSTATTASVSLTQAATATPPIKITFTYGQPKSKPSPVVPNSSSSSSSSSNSSSNFALQELQKRHAELMKHLQEAISNISTHKLTSQVSVSQKSVLKKETVVATQKKLGLQTRVVSHDPSTQSKREHNPKVRKEFLEEIEKLREEKKLQRQKQQQEKLSMQITTESSVVVAINECRLQKIVLQPETTTNQNADQKLELVKEPKDQRIATVEQQPKNLQVECAASNTQWSMKEDNQKELKPQAATSQNPIQEAKEEEEYVGKKLQSLQRKQKDQEGSSSQSDEESGIAEEDEESEEKNNLGVVRQLIGFYEELIHQAKNKKK